MKSPANSSQEPPSNLESDPVWKLLGQASPPPASSRALTQKITATARITPQASPKRRWSLLRHPAMLATAAAVMLGAIPATIWLGGTPPIPQQVVGNATTSPEVPEIEEIAETEALLAAIDHLDDFSDSEIVELLGF